MIGQILVWKLKDTYKAMFEIDSQTIAANPANVGTGLAVMSRMRAFESFVRVQSDAALREVAGMFAYDENGDINNDDLTLRAGGSEINDILIDIFTVLAIFAVLAFVVYWTTLLTIRIAQDLVNIKHF